MAVDYEVEYNNRARVPEHVEIIEGWGRDAEAYRAEADCEIGIAYGPSERQKLDLFWPRAGRGGAPVAVFVHGGYWRSLDRPLFSHMARGANAHGIAVAVPGYDLCPTVTIGQIIDQIRAACATIAARFPGPLVVAGHSAGGHLAACMLGTDWSKVAPGLPRGLVRAALPVSGVFDLRPLVETSMNADLRLDEAEAACVSPLLWQAPEDGILHAAVGDQESHEFLRQSREISSAWGAAGVHTAYVEIPGANHFTAIESFAEPHGSLTERLARLVARVRGDAD